MEKTTEDMLADAAYFRALENAKKLYEQVEYFRNKKSPNREKMVELAIEVLNGHIQIVEQMTVEYSERNEKGRV